MPLRERIERVLQIAVLIFILAAAGFLSAITTMRIAIRGRIVQVPNVVSQDSRTAQKMLRDRGITMRVADRIYNAAPAERVLRQIPAAGEQVKVGQQAHVVLSLGSRRVPIPLLESRSLRAARIELLRAGLQIGEISAPYLPEQDSETVLQQDPLPGVLAASPHVNLLVSQGTREPAYVMPALVGLSASDAQRVLAAAGLRGVRLSFVPSDSAHGAVVKQVPAAGSRVTVGAAVELQIAE